MYSPSCSPTSDPLVSIIIAVYNSQQILPGCLQSLQELDYRPLELIFVNDGSTDQSVQLLNKFAAEVQHDAGIRVVLLQHESNRGIANTRNTGLNAASGEYIYFVDDDDRLEPDTLTAAVEKARTAQADIVGFSWYLCFRTRKRRMNQASFATPWEALEKMMQGTLRWNLWLFLVRRSLYEQHAIRFTPDKNLGEDLLVMVKLFVHAQTVAFVDKALYHYQKSNVKSMTATYFPPAYVEQITANVEGAAAYLQKSPYADRIGNLLLLLKLNIKLPLLISNNTAHYEQWRSWFAEANTQVCSNKALSRRIRWIQCMALKKHYGLLRLHYYAVIRVVYGFIFK